MLILSRHKNESIIIAHEIVITVVEIRGDKVRLGIEAPPYVSVNRAEVEAAIDRRMAEEAESSQAPPLAAPERKIPPNPAAETPES